MLPVPSFVVAKSVAFDVTLWLFFGGEQDTLLAAPDAQHEIQVDESLQQNFCAELLRARYDVLPCMGWGAVLLVRLA